MDWGAAAAAERAPVGDDAVLDRVLEREDATLGLRLVADVRVLLAHADHHAGLARPADDGREDGARRVVAREARLAHAGAVVHHERRNLVVRHFSVDYAIRDERVRRFPYLGARGRRARRPLLSRSLSLSLGLSRALARSRSLARRVQTEGTIVRASEYYVSAKIMAYLWVDGGWAGHVIARRSGYCQVWNMRMAYTHACHGRQTEI